MAFRFRFSVTVAAFIASIASPAALADEGGLSFWLPGNFGSFAAVPSEPGLALPLVYYHSKADEGGSATFPRNGRITAGVNARADFVFIAPTYIFASPVAGGQPSLSLAAAFGPLKIGVDATVTGPSGTVLSGSTSDSRVGVSDLYPMASLRWNRGVHNFMAYTMGGIPVGTYDTSRLSNFSTNHWSVDGGGGYTYFNPKNGHELSAVLGFSYNFENPATQYKNGVDAHLDWAASHFFLPTFHAGVAGYVYNQLSADTGAGAKLGEFKSRVAAIGGQAGYFFEVGQHKWYANLKGYYEYTAHNRPKGWNVWLALAIPLGGK